MRRKIGIIIILMILAFGFDVSCVNAAKNPYKQQFTLNGTKQNNCTWYAWQHVHDKAGISLPGWGNASTWYSSAKKAGFEVGQKPKNNSILVTSFHSNGKNLGHVEYVEKVDGDKLYKWGTSNCYDQDYPPLVSCLNSVQPADLDSENYMEEYLVEVNARYACYKKYGKVISCLDYASAYSNSDLLIGYIYLDNVPNTTTVTKKTTITTKKETKTTTKSTVVSESGNAYLSSLTIEGIQFDFDKDTLEYDIDVDNELSFINIQGNVEDATSTINGLGKYEISEGKNSFKVVVTAKDGSSNIYSLNINRKEKDETTTKNTNNEIKNDKIREKDNRFKYIKIILIVLGCLIMLEIIIVLLKRKRS